MASFQKRVFLVFTLGVCLLLTVFSLPIPAGGREGQEVTATGAIQENVNEDSLPADLKQMIAFKTSAGGDLKIYLMCDDSVLVSFLEPADPERAAALSRVDLSDLLALYQAKTGNDDVPGDILRLQEMISANLDRQRSNPAIDRQKEDRIIFPVKDRSARDFGDSYDYYPEGKNLVKINLTDTEFVKHYCDGLFDTECDVCWPRIGGNSKVEGWITFVASYLYVYHGDSSGNGVFHKIKRKLFGSWGDCENHNVPVGWLSYVAYLAAGHDYLKCEAWQGAVTGARYHMYIEYDH